MSNDFTLEEWNSQVLLLAQALVGAISSNFRMVSLDLDGEVWLIKFYLEKEIEEDIEEIEDILCQYTAWQDCYLKCRWEIIIGDQRLPNYPDVGRMVYRRRELVRHE